MLERRPKGENGEPATAAILALEEGLRRERKRAAKSLEQLQRRLERAETGGAETATVTDTRKEAAEPMPTERERELPAEAPREAQAISPSELSQREQELTRERDAAHRAAGDAQVRFDEIAAQVEAASARLDAEVAQVREQADAATAAAVERVQAETEARMRSEAEALLEAQATELKAEADERVRATTERLRAETEKSKPRRFSLRWRGNGPSPPEPEAVEKVAPEKTPGSDTETRVRRLVNLNEATFEQLRAMDMSVTQATRVIAYRERQDGFDSIDDLDSVPGFPKPFREKLKQQLSA